MQYKLDYELIYGVLWVVIIQINMVLSRSHSVDISVEPILEYKHLGNTVQLKIAWNITPPTNELVDVNIVSVSDQRNQFYCKPSMCFRSSVNQSELVLPERPNNNDHAECQLYLNCDYQIVVSLLNLPVKSVLNYTVPDCVNGFCSCYYEKFFPTPTFTANADTTNHSIIKVNYLVQNSNHIPINAKLERIYFSVEKLQNRHTIWESSNNILTTLKEDLEFSQLGIAQKEIILSLKQRLEPGQNISIKAFLTDDRDCSGRSVEQLLYVPTVDITKANDESSKQNEWTTLVIAIFCVIIVCVMAVFMVTYILFRRQQRNHIHNKWRGVCNNADSSSTFTHMIPMHENMLYLDQPLLEARARGELDAMEIPHTALKIGSEIGKGAFGRVFSASVIGVPGKPNPNIVAVKQLKRRPTTDELEEFLNEIATMKKVGRHPNIVSLLGFCTVRQPLLMIMEYVGCGDLVREKREQTSNHHHQIGCGTNCQNCGVRQNSSMSSKNSSSNGNTGTGGGNSTIKFSNSSSSLNKALLSKYAEIMHKSSSSDSSSYITQLDPLPKIVITQATTETMFTSTGGEVSSMVSKHSSLHYVLDHNELHNFAIQIARGMSHLEELSITHRDLAARNILIDENKTLKISDFGLSRMGIYVNIKNKQVPLRWLSLEAIRDSLYSSKSDVWAFGIVLWEIGTLGAFPYPTISNHELLPYLIAGKRLERPENISNELYSLMLKCWVESPSDRPTFNEILSRLEPKQQTYIDFNEIDPNYVFPPTIDDLTPGHIQKHRAQQSNMIATIPTTINNH